MKHLIIYAHPNPTSFNHAILERAITASQPKEVIVRDLNQLAFQPVLSWQECQQNYQGQYAEDIQQEQQYWQDADVITLIYPLWWMGFPAILKGYLDRVLTHGFAYQNTKTQTLGLLKGKQIQQFITMGNSNEKYAEKGVLTALDMTLGNGLFNFCGIEDVQMHFFGCVGLPTKDYNALLDEVERATKGILNRT